jgi:hypothetical protein
MALPVVQHGDHKDSIFWKWMAYKKFSVPTPYECQFLESIMPFPAPEIWSAYSEHKSIFFAWLVLHNRVLTRDNMIKKNWPCDHLCGFCQCFMETTQHLLCECNYTKAVWNSVANAFNLPGFHVMQQEEGPINWFKVILRSGAAKEKRKRSGIIITVWWLL